MFSNNIFLFIVIFSSSLCFGMDELARITKATDGLEAAEVLKRQESRRQATVEQVREKIKHWEEAQLLAELARKNKAVSLKKNRASLTCPNCQSVHQYASYLKRHMKVHQIKQPSQKQSPTESISVEPKQSSVSIKLARVYCQKGCGKGLLNRRGLHQHEKTCKGFKLDSDLLLPAEPISVRSKQPSSVESTKIPLSKRMLKRVQQ